MTKTTNGIGKRRAEQIANPWALNGMDMMLTVTRMQGYAVQSMLKYNLEVLDFFKHRLEQDLKAVSAVIGCQKAEDVYEVGSKFVQTAISEYADKAGQLADVSSKLANETAEHVQEETASIADSLSARHAA